VSHFVTNMFKKIKEGSVVLMVLDATDIEGSIPQEYIPKIATGDYELFIVINKVDCIPNTVSKERLKGWFSSRLRDLMPGINVVSLLLIRTTNISPWCLAKRPLVSRDWSAR
jgi:ribosome biogenesis GTPase A